MVLDCTKPEEAGFWGFFAPVHFKCVLNSRDKKYYCFHVLTSILPERSNHWNSVYHFIEEKISRLGLKTKSNMFLTMIALSADELGDFACVILRV